jgi:hypothetical protein
MRGWRVTRRKDTFAFGGSSPRLGGKGDRSRQEGFKVALNDAKIYSRRHFMYTFDSRRAYARMVDILNCSVNER